MTRFLLICTCCFFLFTLSAQTVLIPAYTGYALPAEKENIQLGILQSVQVTIPRGQRKNLQADFTLNQQLLAPITKGQQVGTIYLKLNGEDIATYPLVALEDVAEGGFFSRMIDYIKMQFN